jgi:hypothetical protein
MISHSFLLFPIGSYSSTIFVLPIGSYSQYLYFYFPCVESEINIFQIKFPLRLYIYN